MIEPRTDTERMRRWRMVLGSEAESSCGVLTGPSAEMDQALASLYDADGPGGMRPKDRRGGSSASAPSVARWLGDIRKYFPSSIVQVMQRDALERLNMRDMLLQPEMLRSVQPDVHLVANLMALSRVSRPVPGRQRAHGGAQCRRRVDAATRRPDALGHQRRDSTAASAIDAHATLKSTGTAPFVRTSNTGSPNTERSCPRRCWVSVASHVGRSARSCSASIRAAPWPIRSSTPASSAQ